MNMKRAENSGAKMNRMQKAMRKMKENRFLFRYSCALTTFQHKHYYWTDNIITKIDKYKTRLQESKKPTGEDISLGSNEMHWLSAEAARN